MESPLVRDLAVVMAASGITTAVFHRLRQPVVLGYILAGVVIGPYTPPFSLVTDVHSIETLAELGVILLLFSIGLEFSFRKLRRVGGVAIAGAAFEIPVMVWLGFSAGRMIGWPTTESIFLGAILSISSTTIIAKALDELGETRTEYARVVMGILIVEDLAAVVMLVLLSSVARAGTVAIGQATLALGGVTLFVVVTTIVGLLVVPRILQEIARTSAHEVLIVTVLGFCFGVAILASSLGLSVALGAFLIGAVMAETKQVHQIEERIESIRDVFSAIFFVAVGMQIDPWVIFDRAPLVIGLALITVLGKVGACSLASLACGYGPRTALRVGLALGQIGEFSFIIAALGRQLGVVSENLYPLTVAVSAVTTLSTPYQIRGADRIASRLASALPLRLRSFLEFYRRKLGAIRLSRSSFPPEARRAVGQGFISIALVIALLLATDRVAQLADRHGVKSLLLPHDVEVLLWSFFGLLALPPLMATWRACGVIARRLLGAGADGAPSVILVESIRFGLLVAGGAVFLAVTSPIVPTGIPLVVVATVVALAAIVFSRSVASLQSHAETQLRTLFSEDEPTQGFAGAREELRRLITTKYPFEVAVEDFVIPFHSTACNQAIRDIGLRQRTGATIAAVFRDDQAIVNPDPGLELRSGDILALLGSAEQVSNAVRELQRLASEGKP